MVVRELALSEIRSSHFNPRKDFDEGYLSELSHSLSQDGQWEPIVVRDGGDGTYELICGECRLRAAARLGWRTIKANVVEVPDREAMVLALKSNLMRRNLNVVEEADALERILSASDMTQSELAQLLDKKQSWISRRLSLASRICQHCKDAIRTGEISASHGLSLAKLPEKEQIEVCMEIARRGLGVRAARTLVERHIRSSGSMALHGSGVRSRTLPDTRELACKMVGRYAEEFLRNMELSLGQRPDYDQYLAPGEMVLVIRIPFAGSRSLSRRDLPAHFFDGFSSAQSFAKRQGGYCTGLETINGENMWVLYIDPEVVKHAKSPRSVRAEPPSQDDAPTARSSARPIEAEIPNDRSRPSRSRTIR